MSDKAWLFPQALATDPEIVAATEQLRTSLLECIFRIIEASKLSMTTPEELAELCEQMAEQFSQTFQSAVIGQHTRLLSALQVELGAPRGTPQ